MSRHRFIVLSRDRSCSICWSSIYPSRTRCCAQTSSTHARGHPSAECWIFMRPRLTCPKKCRNRHVLLFNSRGDYDWIWRFGRHDARLARRMPCRMTNPMTGSRAALPQHPALGHHLFVLELGPPVLELLQLQSLGLAIFALIEAALAPLREMRLPKSAKNLASQSYTAIANPVFSLGSLTQREKSQQPLCEQSCNEWMLTKFAATERSCP